MKLTCFSCPFKSMRKSHTERSGLFSISTEADGYAVSANIFNILYRKIMYESNKINTCVKPTNRSLSFEGKTPHCDFV